jgi:hypothetical protein
VALFDRYQRFIESDRVLAMYERAAPDLRLLDRAPAFADTLR